MLAAPLVGVAWPSRSLAWLQQDAPKQTLFGIGECSHGSSALRKSVALVVVYFPNGTLHTSYIWTRSKRETPFQACTCSTCLRAGKDVRRLAQQAIAGAAAKQRPPPQRTIRPQRQHGREGARALLIAVLGGEHALEGHVHLDLQHGAPDGEPPRDPPVELLLQNPDELLLAQLLVLGKESPQPPRADSRLPGKPCAALKTRPAGAKRPVAAIVEAKVVRKLRPRTSRGLRSRSCTMAKPNRTTATPNPNPRVPAATPTRRR